MIERNLAEVELSSDDSSWNIYYGERTDDSNTLNFNCLIGKNKIVSYSKVISDRFNFHGVINGKNGWDQDTENISVSADRIYITINKHSLLTQDVAGFKQWLSENPTTVVYQLKTPIYEPLNIDLSLNTYLNTTYLSNDSIIPCNMKIVFDRTMNKATEAIKLAEENPTLENLSKARMWTNLLKESLNKDNLQNQISNITQMEDLTIEPKKVSSTLDVYVKSKNSLTMSLSTNSIIFDNFTGVDDMEKLNAVNLTVNSSLPYQLNSYMMTELKNNDNTKVIPKELLNIRLNGETDYKAFTNINEKLVLKEDCERGNNNQFNIDLILKGSLTHKADVYKTTIKFEAEQK